ncbi:uncharacterized protein K02A2.6-like [Liolophura sinensis]|uniref:uncharacterized protein K02A2.6-like n=1 Tax=Liolophura sinensis TaxID=3198878 RepID=UPI003159205A
MTIDQPITKQFLTKESVVKENKGIFTELSCLPAKAKIRLQDNALPVVHAPRRVPVALRDRVKNELKRMESMGVIRAIDEPTEWVSSMVAVAKKDSTLRICIDPKDSNENIVREHYQLPTTEDITHKLAGAKYFSRLDAKSGY